MTEVILELPEMPINCLECELYIPHSDNNDYDYCAGIPGGLCKYPIDGKRSDCPLKLVEGKDVEP